MMDTKIKYSEEVQAMITKIPLRVVVVGIVVFVVNICLIFMLTYYIKYPQVVSFSFNSANAHWVFADTDILVQNSTGITEKLLSLNIADVSQLKIGNEVNVHFNNINQNRKGVLKGKVMEIAKDSTGSRSCVVIGFSSALKTTHNYVIPDNIPLNGTCDFITLNTRFLSRFLDKLK